MGDKDFLEVKRGRPAAFALGQRPGASEPYAFERSRSLPEAVEEVSLEVALGHELVAILSCVCEGQTQEDPNPFLEKREPSYCMTFGGEVRP